MSWEKVNFKTEGLAEYVINDQIESTRMHEAMQILNEYKIRTHQYCMMD